MIKLLQLLKELEINNPNKLLIYVIPNNEDIYVLLPNKYKYYGYKDEDGIYFNLNTGEEPMTNSMLFLQYISKFGIDINGYNVNEEGSSIYISDKQVVLKYV